jgi:hypothetical protein
VFGRRQITMHADREPRHIAEFRPTCVVECFATHSKDVQHAMTHRAATRGLLLRKGIWHIDKVLFGKRVCESTHTSDLKEAEMLLAHRVNQARKVHLYGEPAEHTFTIPLSRYPNTYNKQR